MIELGINTNKIHKIYGCFILPPSFFSSDPYVKIELNTKNGEQTIDSVLTKTKKKVMFFLFSKLTF